MRKVKVVILLAVVILSLILLNANAEEVNEGENFCDLHHISYQPFIEVNITAKDSYNGEVMKYQFPTFKQGSILFVTSLGVINMENCTLPPFSISFPVISPSGRRNVEDLAPFQLTEKLNPYGTYVFENNTYGYVPGGGGLPLDEIGTWTLELANAKFSDDGYGNYEYRAPLYLNGDRSSWSRKYTFQVETKTTLENLDLAEASVKLAEETKRLSRLAIFVAYAIGFLTIIIGILNFYYLNFAT